MLGVKYLFVANLNLLSDEKGTISDKTEMFSKKCFFLWYCFFRQTLGMSERSPWAERNHFRKDRL